MASEKWLVVDMREELVPLRTLEGDLGLPTMDVDALVSQVFYYIMRLDQIALTLEDLCEETAYSDSLFSTSQLTDSDRDKIYHAVYKFGANVANKLLFLGLYKNDELSYTFERMLNNDDLILTTKLY